MLRRGDPVGRPTTGNELGEAPPRPYNNESSRTLHVLDRTRGQLVFGGDYENEDEVEQDYDAE